LIFGAMIGRRKTIGPLGGLRVIDVTQMLAGPYCTWLLGGLGADVIKVERPGQGDFTRSIGPFLGGHSLYFLSVNRNKRSLTLNLKTEAGREILKRLATTADIFVENYRPGVMERLGLGYDDLAAVNPRLVYASVSGYGHTGPYRARPAFDLIVQALSGMMSVTGEPDRPPVRVGVSIGDIAASLFAAVGILAALQERGRTGLGTFVDVSMLDCQLALLENAIGRLLNAGELPMRLGSRHPLIVPFQAFPTQDDPIVVCVDTENQWRRFCSAIGRDDLLHDARFRDGTARASHHADLEPILADVFRSRGSRVWLQILDEADVPCAPINTVAAAVRDPQVRARGMIVEVDIPDRGRAGFAGIPIRTSSYTPRHETPPPRLGEHTRCLLEEIGFSGDEINRLQLDGII
jgi:crotonobetainyl-CoA:carnitine CoA-transferase CaiB-like acyl-CoA transferase